MGKPEAELLFFDEKGEKREKKESVTRAGQLLMGAAYWLSPSSSEDGEKKSLLLNCAVFDGLGQQHVQLSDKRGCLLESSLLQQDGDRQLLLKSAFRFPSSSSSSSQVDSIVNFQCLRVSCPENEECPSPCSDEAAKLSGILVAASMRVVDSLDCTLHQLKADWLLFLLIALGVLLMLMFCVNLFLCSSLSCTCTRLFETRDGDEDDDTKSGRFDDDLAHFDYDPYLHSGQGNAGFQTAPPSAIDGGSYFGRQQQGNTMVHSRY